MDTGICPVETEGQMDRRAGEDWTNAGLKFLSDKALDYYLIFQSASSCVFQFLPVRAQRQPTGDEQHPEPRHHASFCGRCRGGRCDRKRGCLCTLFLCMYETPGSPSVSSDSGRNGFQPAAHQAPQQQHRHQAVLPKRRFTTHRSPTGNPRETQIANWQSSKICLCIWLVSHHYPW